MEKVRMLGRYVGSYLLILLGTLVCFSLAVLLSKIADVRSSINLGSYFAHTLVFVAFVWWGNAHFIEGEKYKRREGKEWEIVFGCMSVITIFLTSLQSSEVLFIVLVSALPIFLTIGFFRLYENFASSFKKA